MKVLIITFGFFLMSYQLLAQPLPKGWRYPSKIDITGGWKAFIKEIPKPYYVKADFNGDGETDHAWILFNDKKKCWGLFVYVSKNKNIHEWIKLEGAKNDKWDPHYMGICLVKPGKYRTACGKEYWNCEKGEPEELKLDLPSINFFKYESANSFFFWDKGQFRRIWISD